MKRCHKVIYFTTNTLVKHSRYEKIQWDVSCFLWLKIVIQTSLLWMLNISLEYFSAFHFKNYIQPTLKSQKKILLPLQKLECLCPSPPPFFFSFFYSLTTEMKTHLSNSHWLKCCFCVFACSLFAYLFINPEPAYSFFYYYWYLIIKRSAIEGYLEARLK